MKKFLLSLSSIALSLLCLSAFAQDKQSFNHLAMGVTAGVDGFGLEIAVPVTPQLQVQGGYSFLPIGFTFFPNLGKTKFADNDADLTALKTDVSFLDKGMGNLMLDFYPGGGDSSFKLVAGVFVCPGTLTHFKMDMHEQIKERDWKTGFGYRGVQFSTDGEGFGHLAAVSNKVMPYLGLGFGRAVSPDKRVTFTGELGVAYTGGIWLISYDYSHPDEVRTYEVTTNQLTDDNGRSLDMGYVDKIAAIPVFPVLKLGLFVRLF